MGALLGLTLGAGLLLIWQSLGGGGATRRRDSSAWQARTRDRLVQAGLEAISPVQLVGISAGLALLVWIVAAGVTQSPAIGLFLGLLAARGPFALVTSRAGRRVARLREAWPEAVDHLASGVRAGLSLAEAVGQVGDRGPLELRPAFQAFAHDFRATGRFGDSLDALKARLADPIGDRLVEALRVTREVGGSDLGRVLRTLGGFLREEARTRGELEARQSWTVNAARLAVVAPWLVLVVLAGQPAASAAYNSPAGVTVLALGAASTMLAYRLMIRVGRLPRERRVLR